MKIIYKAWDGTEFDERDACEKYEYDNPCVLMYGDAGRTLKADEALEKQYKQLKFTEDVITGRTQVIVDNPEKTMNREQRRAAAKQAKKIAAKHKRGK